MLIAIDQEGGQVDRFKLENLDNTPQAQIKSLKQAYDIAKSRGEALKNLGINLNFSPVLEVVTSKMSYINLFSRAFLASGQEEVLEFGQAMITGYQDAGITAVPKHFPGGLGRVLQDPHQTLPIINISRKELDQDIYPYKKLIENKKLKAVMITHLKYPQIDPDLASSLSKTFITSILRADLGFQGVVITDDLKMKAITNNYSIPEAAKLAFQAGADLILISSNKQDQKQAYQALLQAVYTGEIPESRVDQSLLRILSLEDK